MGIVAGIATYIVDSKSSKRYRGCGELCIPVPEPDTFLGLIVTVPLLLVGGVGLAVCSLI